MIDHSNVFRQIEIDFKEEEEEEDEGILY